MEAAVVPAAQSRPPLAVVTGELEREHVHIRQRHAGLQVEPVLEQPAEQPTELSGHFASCRCSRPWAIGDCVDIEPVGVR